jgi:3-oxoacyl-[acyl-carrier-protein] synthase-3
MYNATITAVGGYVPPFILDNEKLSLKFDVTKEYIYDTTGINQRHVWKEHKLGVAHLASKSVLSMLSGYDIDVNSIDVIIFCTSTPDSNLPSAASRLCSLIGSRAWCFDLNAACSGFLYGLSLASSMIRGGSFKKVLVVGADIMTSCIDPDNKNTSMVFGDGGGCAVLEPSQDYGIIDTFLGSSENSGEEHLNIKSGGSAIPISNENLANKEHFIYMNGSTVFKNAVKYITHSIEHILQKNQLNIEDINWFIVHQANKRILDKVANNLNLPNNRILVNIDRYGNTSNATIPLLLNDFSHLFKNDDKIIVSAFGAGFTWGSVYLKWCSKIV